VKSITRSGVLDLEPGQQLLLLSSETPVPPHWPEMSPKKNSNCQTRLSLNISVYSEFVGPSARETFGNLWNDVQLLQFNSRIEMNIMPVGEPQAGYQIIPRNYGTV
jgi:hypothetical protein